MFEANLEPYMAQGGAHFAPPPPPGRIGFKMFCVCKKKLLGAACVEECKYFPIFVILPHSQDLNPLDRPQTLKYTYHRLQILWKPFSPSF